MQLLFELGVFGLVAFFWLAGSMMRQLWALLKLDRLAGYTLLVLVANLLVCSFSDNMFYYLSYNWYLWFAVGAGCAVCAHNAPAAPPAPVRFPR